VTTQTEALAQALDRMAGGDAHGDFYAEWDDAALFAAGILAALPEDSALVTVESLSAALHAEWGDTCEHDMDGGGPRRDCERFAATLIEAVRRDKQRPEAKRCGCRVTSSLPDVCPACGHREHSQRGCDYIIEAVRRG
jgi:hypothetical protein